MGVGEGGGWAALTLARPEASWLQLPYACVTCRTRTYAFAARVRACRTCACTCVACVRACASAATTWSAGALGVGDLREPALCIGVKVMGVGLGVGVGVGVGVVVGVGVG